MARPTKATMQHRARIAALEHLGDRLLQHYIALLDNEPGSLDAKALGEVRRYLESTASLDSIANEQRRIVTAEAKEGQKANPALTSLIDGVLANVDTDYLTATDNHVRALLRGDKTDD